MTPLVRLEGVAAPFDFADVDTDQIVPKQFLKTIEREGLARALFHDLRFDEAGAPRRDFILNRAGFREARFLVTGPNFGSGSSREHAAWALLDFGIRCLVGWSFADIFRANCFENGILPVTLGREAVAAILATLDAPRVMALDLEAQVVVDPLGVRHAFEIEADRKDRLLRGLDAIDETITHEAAITAYEQRRTRGL
jgi:3-isopropylmalate dehydratase/3-isopropylmalate/(R)-2-methylmalate dehydratase small subunit